MAENPAARLVQDEVAQALVAGDPTALLPDRLARRGCYAANDYVADLSFGMGGDHMNGLHATHRYAL